MRFVSRNDDTYFVPTYCRGEMSGLQGKLAQSEKDKGTASAEMAALRGKIYPLYPFVINQ